MYTDFLLKSSKAFRIIGNVEATLFTINILPTLVDAKTFATGGQLFWVFCSSLII